MSSFPPMVALRKYKLLSNGVLNEASARRIVAAVVRMRPGVAGAMAQAEGWEGRR